MTKWICNECKFGGQVCKCETTLYAPVFCVFHKEKQTDWRIDNTDLNTATIESVETKTTLPDWCKVGEWVCIYNHYKKEWEYFKVNETKGNYISSDNGLKFSFCDLMQARIRPYNAKEMRGLVGKVLEWGNNSELVISYNEAEVEVYVDRMWCTAEYLMDNEYTIDGKPCGVLEHLNDNGEWVE